MDAIYMIFFVMHEGQKNLKMQSDGRNELLKIQY